MNADVNILVTIYNPVDLFPPSINAIEGLAKRYASVTLLTNAMPAGKWWTFPANVTVHYVNQWSNDNATRGLFQNINRFLKYLFKLRRLLKTSSFELVLLYEPHAALAYKLIVNKKKQKHLLWYHNHDIYEMERMRKYSLGWFSAKAEQKIFPTLSMFSLPANERKAYFPMKDFGGHYFFLPNYPSIALYGSSHQIKTVSNEIRLLYQGKITEGHGLEELLELLPERIGERKITLHIKGPADESYIRKLTGLAASFKVSGQIYFYELTSYLEVPQLAASCHIGIGIHTKTDIMHSTLGTSSNKIYEYAASGLPVLLYDNSHFREYLDIYPWAKFTDCSKVSLKRCISEIIEQYKSLSSVAFKDFSEKLNFENYFLKPCQFISTQTRE